MRSVGALLFYLAAFTFGVFVQHAPWSLAAIVLLSVVGAVLHLLVIVDVLRGGITESFSRTEKMHALLAVILPIAGRYAAYLIYELIR